MRTSHDLLLMNRLVRHDMYCRTDPIIFKFIGSFQRQCYHVGRQVHAGHQDIVRLNNNKWVVNVMNGHCVE